MKWFTKWFRGLQPSHDRGANLLLRKTRRQNSASRSQFQLVVEPLEDRTLPSSGWAAALGTTGGTWAHAVGVDPSSGAVYVAGNQIAKYTTDGHLLWSQSLGGSSFLANVAWSVAIDQSGAVYASGYFTGTLTLGSQSLVSAGSDGAFVAKFDPSGNVLWAESFGGTGENRGYGVAVDATGVYVTGRFSSTVSFGANHSLTSAGDTDIFVLKLDHSGNVVYATGAGGAGHDTGIDIAVDGSSQAYVTGYFAGAASFGAVNLTSTGTYNGFISQVDVNGNFTWARQTTSSITTNQAAVQVQGIAVDGSGHVFATGTFNGAAAFGDTQDDGSGATNLTALGTADAFVTSLDDVTGHFLWTKQLGGASAGTTGYGLALDGAGNVYTDGGFGGPTGAAMDCDPGAGSAILTSGYLCELSPTGNFLGAWQTGATGIAVGPDGSVYMAGSFTYTARIDTGTQYATLNSSGLDGFISRMTPGLSVIMGQAYIDQNHNGVKDASDAPYAGGTVYLDLNNNGVRNSGEPYTTTNAQGGFSFYHLAPGTYTVREVAPSGYTITTPTSFTLTLAVGQFDDNSSFGDYKAPKTTIYSNTRPVTTSRRNPDAYSNLTIGDNYPIQDLSVTLNVGNSALRQLTIYLYAPDGTTITLASNITSTGALTFHVPALDGKNVNGTWALEVDGLAGGTLNSWSLSVFG